MEIILFASNKSRKETSNFCSRKMISGLSFYQAIAQNRNHICMFEMATTKTFRESTKGKHWMSCISIWKQPGLFTMQIRDIGPTTNIQLSYLAATASIVDQIVSECFCTRYCIFLSAECWILIYSNFAWSSIVIVCCATCLRIIFT